MAALQIFGSWGLAHWGPFGLGGPVKAGSLGDSMITGALGPLGLGGNGAGGHVA